MSPARIRIGNSAERPIKTNILTLGQLHVACQGNVARISVCGMSTAALFAHPGHELRALGWCMRHKPKVFFVTNGQGSRERGRLETSLRILKEIGCDASPLSGCFSDGEIYEAMLANRPQKIAEFFRSVQRELDGGMFQQLIFDRVEGFNPTHDLVALLGRELAQVMARGRPKTEFSVCGISLEASPEDDERHPAAVEICRCTDEEVTVK